jgi:hypothetical protein
MNEDWAKASAFRGYRRARQILAHNRGLKRPGQAVFIKYGERACESYEKQYPDLREAFAELYGARYG